MMDLSISNAKILQKLILINIINGSEFKNKKLLAQLVEENILKIQQLTPCKSKIHLINFDNLKSYLKNEFNIKDLDKYIEILTSKGISRSELIEVSGDSKTKYIQTQTGLYIAGYENVILSFNEKKFNIANILEGTSLFIHHDTKFTIDKDILIVGVENVENLLQIQKQKYLFEKFKKDKLFVLLNPPMLKFIEISQNKYLHFGDIDLAGISIYETKVKTKIKNSDFFIPASIEEDLKDGKKQLYFRQYEKYKSLISDTLEIQVLIDLIHKYQKVVEQEIFITNTVNRNQTVTKER